VKVVAYPHANFCCVRSATEALLAHQAEVISSLAKRCQYTIGCLEAIDCQTPVRVTDLALEGLHEAAKRMRAALPKDDPQTVDAKTIYFNTHPSFLRQLKHYHPSDYLGTPVPATQYPTKQ
jgi:hypothetical protein